MKTNKQPNARFWIFVNLDWVKVTLTPGQRITFSNGGATDEGYGFSAESYEYDEFENVIECDRLDWGRDCDGSYSSNRIYFCPVDRLHIRPSECKEGYNTSKRLCGLYNRPATPLWSKTLATQYDESAERAGY
jgi:hypothetical protein